MTDAQYKRHQQGELTKLERELEHPVEHRRKRAQEEIERYGKDFESKAYVEANGVVRWKSNDRVPPLEILGAWNYLSKPFDLVNSVEAQEKDSAAFAAAYRERMKDHVPSAEERYEMRAAFGEGAEVVNVITGRKYRT